MQRCSRATRIVLPLLLIAGVAWSAPATRNGGIDLVWHWEGAGETGGHEADRSINPASVVKLATTLWALEVLGPEHRFRTTVFIRGTVDPVRGALAGDVIVSGDGDPDFHVENAQLVAERLNELGIRSIDGALHVGPAFWIGWENGLEGTIRDAERRGKKMAQRMADAWNPRTWRPQTLRAMREFRAHRPETRFIHLPVTGVGGLYTGDLPAEPAVEHLSSPLAATLKRFNDYSNNDIERFGHHLGSAAEMAEFYRARWEDPRPPIRFATLSGLGSNRLSPRQITRLIRELSSAARDHGLVLDDLLPALDCGKNTLRNYRGLHDGIPTAGLVGKTGTLVQTDGGVIALAGSVRTADGDVAFFVGAPNNGARVNAARRAQTRWLLDLAVGWNVRGSTCRGEQPRSYGKARVYLARSE